MRTERIIWASVLFLVAAFFFYLIFAMWLNENSADQKINFSFTTKQKATDQTMSPIAMTQQNTAVAEKAIQILFDKCPEISRYAASIDSDSLHALAIVHNTHEFMRRKGTMEWPSMIEISFRMKKDWKDLDPSLIHHSHNAPGDYISYAVGGGEKPGVLVEKGIMTHPLIGDNVCGKTITDNEHSNIFIDVPAMKVVDQLR